MLRDIVSQITKDNTVEIELPFEPSEGLYCFLDLDTPLSEQLVKERTLLVNFEVAEDKRYYKQNTNTELYEKIKPYSEYLMAIKSGNNIEDKMINMFASAKKIGQILQGKGSNLTAFTKGFKDSYLENFEDNFKILKKEGVSLSNPKGLEISEHTALGILKENHEWLYSEERAYYSDKIHAFYSQNAVDLDSLLPTHVRDNTHVVVETSKGAEFKKIIDLGKPVYLLFDVPLEFYKKEYDLMLRVKSIKGTTTNETYLSDEGELQANSKFIKLLYSRKPYSINYISPLKIHEEISDLERFNLAKFSIWLYNNYKDFNKYAIKTTAENKTLLFNFSGELNNPNALGYTLTIGKGQSGWFIDSFDLYNPFESALEIKGVVNKWNDSSNSFIPESYSITNHKDLYTLLRTKFLHAKPFGDTKTMGNAKFRKQTFDLDQLFKNINYTDDLTLFTDKLPKFIYMSLLNTYKEVCLFGYNAGNRTEKVYRSEVANQITMSLDLLNYFDKDTEMLLSVAELENLMVRRKSEDKSIQSIKEFLFIAGNLSKRMASHSLKFNAEYSLTETISKSTSFSSMLSSLKKLRKKVLHALDEKDVYFTEQLILELESYREEDFTFKTTDVLYFIQGVLAFKNIY